MDMKLKLVPLILGNILRTGFCLSAFFWPAIFIKAIADNH